MPDISSNFSRNRPLSELTAGDIQDMIDSAIEQRIGALRPGGLAGSHVNSGPPGHANEPGHANFDPKIWSSAGEHVQPEARLRNQLVTITLPDGNKVTMPETMINSAIEQRIGALRPGGLAGSHVNSGPPGHANGPGHANFDPKVWSSAGIRVQPEVRLRDQVVTITLPDGNKVSVPETGPLNMVVGGFQITR